MQNLKVMIVDDEILAVEDLRDLIKWEHHGFKVSAATTSSKEALVLFEKYHPEVVFLDINMPLIDGLELGKTLQQLNPNVKIIILTAYRDFDYAKKAVEIGACNYILKHEINEERLIQELKKIKEQYENEKKGKDRIRKQLLRELFRGENVIEELKKNYFHAFNSNQIYSVMAVKIDEPFAIYNEGKENYKINITLDENKYLDLDKDILSIDILNNGESKYLILIALKKIYSQQQYEELTYKIACQIQRDIRILYETVVSICIEEMVHGISQLASNYKKILSFTDYSVFIGMGKIFRSRDIKYVNKFDSETLEENIRKIEGHLKEFNYEPAAKCINFLFDKISSPYYSLEGLRELCRLLYKTMFRFAKEKIYANEGVLVYEKSLELPKCNDIKAIEKYFLMEYKSLIEKALRFNNMKFSRKVQQIIAYIQKHYTEDITIDQVAESLDISTVYLSQLFKKETGQTFLEYCTSYRIEIAKDLIDSGEYKIYEVANMVGYKTSQYFSQVFRKAIGCNPLDYKQGGNMNAFQNKN